jgi:AP-1-like transcription factor
VRELEQKLNDLQQVSSDLHADNERLKRELAKMATENEILRATSQAGIATPMNGHTTASEPTTTGPMKFQPTDLGYNVKEDGTREPVHRVVISEETGEKLLDASATWDMIQSHDLYKQGLVDMAHVFDKLKDFARCDGQGVVYEERSIRLAIEESVAGGRDELI